MFWVTIKISRVFDKFRKCKISFAGQINFNEFQNLVQNPLLY